MKKPISSSQMEHLIRKAFNGDNKSAEKLVDIANEYGKLTNDRMARLKKAGYDMFAYDRAETAAFEQGRKRFKTTWKTDDLSYDTNDFILSLRETRLFLSREVSTVRGAKAKAENFLQQMDANKWIKRSKLSEKTQQELVHLMGDGGLRELISITYESVEDVLSTITDDLEKGATFDEVSDKIDSIITGELDYDDYFGVMKK